VNWQDLIGRVWCGDALDWLGRLPSAWANCCITSPPYWGLRDYGTAIWLGGQPDCDHVEQTIRVRRNLAAAAEAADGHKRNQQNRKDDGGIDLLYRARCGKCGAARVDRQYGLEPTPEAYIERMVAVFAEVRRVLRPDGVLWLNMGDSYAGSGGAGGDYNEGGLKEGQPRYRSTFRPGSGRADGIVDERGQRNRNGTGPVPGLKPKDLCMMPARLALALQADGWYLRCDVVWAKPNPMPESVTDRPTKSHEYVFLLTKSERYFYDADAVREAGSMDSHGGGRSDPTRSHRLLTGGAQRGLDMATPAGAAGRNLRSVWTINTQPWPEAHFATFPEKLVATCLLAGCPEKVCAECGEPWVRRVETSGGTVGKSWHPHEADAEVGMSQAHHHGGVGEAIDEHGERYARRDLGIFPACECGGATRPGLVIDPFLGSGTVGAVALKHGREFAGCDLNPTYCAMAEKRIAREREKMRLDFGEAAVAATKGSAEHV